LNCLVAATKVPSLPAYVHLFRPGRQGVHKGKQGGLGQGKTPFQAFYLVYVDVVFHNKK